MKYSPNFGKALLLLLFVPFAFSCASIVSRSNWPFYVESDPAGATVSIENKKGREIFRGKTPTVVRLRSGSGFFSKESYVIHYSRPGYEDKSVNVECKLNGWYFGNIIFGGAIGLLIVDPATGAMYKLDGKGSRETLLPSQQASTQRSLKVMDIANIPADWHGRLIALHN